jgi:hypothetical protein
MGDSGGATLRLRSVLNMNFRICRRHDIWRRLSDRRAVRYVCFEALGDGLFSVQSADFFGFPVDARVLRYQEDQAIELFIETDPVERGSVFASLDEAIAAHDAEFGGAR